MGLTTVLVQFGLVTSAMLAVAIIAIVGPERLGALRRQYRQRLRAAAPYLLMLLFVLGANRIARTVGPELSWIIGWNITGRIYAIEGESVALLQSFATPALTTYFSFVYLYGYAFLLVFPFIAYLAMEETGPLKQLSLAYAFNYAVGLVLYVAFIAYGPRNFMPELVEPLLYTAYPQSQLLTRQVNANTNVFPSLHSSLAITVALLAWRTRDTYRRWYPIAVILSGSIVTATMYLGIHWLIDVVAGGVLAAASVHLARHRSDEKEADATRLSDLTAYLLRRSRTR
jgi:membrane-associated phospholipid phosphatase